LLSLGIDNPVTKESAGGQYHVSLAKELSSVLEKALKVYKNFKTKKNKNKTIVC